MYSTPLGSNASYGDRLRGVLSLDQRTFRDVEQDTNANGQAALTVLLAALASGIGAYFGQDWMRNMIGGAVSSLVQWIVFSFAAYFVGASLFATPATSVTPGQVLRGIGFAQAPKLLNVLGFIPLVGGIIRLVTFIWFLVAAITALRESFEFDTGRAIGTGLIAMIVAVVVEIVLAIVLGITSGVFGAFSSLLW